MFGREDSQPTGRSVPTPLPQLGFQQIAAAKFLAENWTPHVVADEEGRVRIEDALAVLGSLAGFSVIAALHRIAGSREALQRGGVMVIGTKSGAEYYFGGMLNHVLVDHPVESLLAQVCAPLHAAGSSVPDALLMVNRVAATVGSDEFGVPDLPAEHAVDASAVRVVTLLWNDAVRAAALDELPPQTWTNTFLHAIRILNKNTPGLLDETMRARIVLECALPAAHLDPVAIAA